jgi:hypothetical protein
MSFLAKGLGCSGEELSFSEFLLDGVVFWKAAKDDSSSNFLIGAELLFPWVKMAFTRLS